jgi:hypothetical protein
VCCYRGVKLLYNLTAPFLSVSRTTCPSGSGAVPHLTATTLHPENPLGPGSSSRPYGVAPQSTQKSKDITARTVNWCSKEQIWLMHRTPTTQTCASPTSTNPALVVAYHATLVRSKRAMRGVAYAGKPTFVVSTQCYGWKLVSKPSKVEKHPFPNRSLQT